MKTENQNNRPSQNHGAGEPWTAWELLHRLRLLIVTASLVAPIIILSRSKIVQEQWSRANPTRQAERLIANGPIDPTHATILERACKASPNRPDLLRALATACEAHDPALARRCYEHIEELGATTAGDIAGHALLMAHLNSLADAESLLEGAPSQLSSSLVLLRAKLTIKVQGGDSAGASQAMEELCLVTPDDPDPALEIAGSCQKSGADSSLIAHAERHAISILSRWNKSGQTSKLASRIGKLLDLPLQDSGSRAAAHDLLAALPQPTPAQIIAATALNRLASFSGREQQMLLTTYMETSRSHRGISAGQKDEIAGFLQHQGDHSLVVQLIPASESLTERRLFQRRLTSLLSLGHWRDASEFVSLPGAPASSYNQSLFRALKVLNKAPAATSRTYEMLLTALRDASAEGHAEACFSIGCAALDLNLRGVASDAFAEAVRLAPSDPQILEEMINTARRFQLPLKDLTAAISHGFERHKPGPLVAQRLCYLYLLGHHNEETVRQFVGDQKQNTMDPVYVRFLEALDHYQQGRYAEAFHLLIPLPDYCWHQGETAVIIGILCNAGGADHCTTLAKSIEPAKLFPEERAIMEPWLSRLSLLGSTHPPEPETAQLHTAQR